MKDVGKKISSEVHSVQYICSVQLQVNFMNETKEFENWKKENEDELRVQYRDYLKDVVLGDEDFDVTTTEDFHTWCEVEFDRLKEECNC